MRLSATFYLPACVFGATLVCGQVVTIPSVGPTPGPNPNMLPSPPANASVISGRFALDDGTLPPALVRVELTCNSIPRPMGWSDEKGAFSVRLAINSEDEISDLTYAKGIAPPLSGVISQGYPQPIDTIPPNLQGCDLRGALPGYRSDIVPLSGHQRLDSPEVGTILLHRLGKVEGLTTSATTAMAPEGARKAHEKAIAAVKQRKPEDAIKDLQKAVAIYPKYALAWFDLGRVYEARNHTKEAQEAYGHSIEADDKYLYPYERMYIILSRAEKWPEVLEITNKVIRLDPYDFPRAYYFNAIAKSNLNDLDGAEKSAREAVKLGLAANPRAGYVLGAIVARKQNFTEATELLEAYLKVAPAIEVDVVKRQLEELRKYVAQK
jgi:tetratricopeptide (TPR) repeat protein